jgi:isocitrate dehydrogenase
MSKDNIMKLTDGMFHQVFDEVSRDYPEIETEHLIVDIGMARLADAPELFDVVVTPNLYGDIVSDIAAEISGSVGLAGSANIGEHGALFEAIHGSAPTIAGKNIANPSGLILAACKMLAHIAQGETAERVHNALLCTIEDGIHTVDIYDQSRSKEMASTSRFAEAVVARLGNTPRRLHAAHYSETPPPIQPYRRPDPAEKQLVGVDVFVDRAGIAPEDLAAALRAASETTSLDLVMITNRGVKVWPEGFPETFCTDHWRCRFQLAGGEATSHPQIVHLLQSLADAQIDFIKTEHLCTFDGQAGFSLGQGQ